MYVICVVFLQARFEHRKGKFCPSCSLSFSSITIDFIPCQIIILMELVADVHGNTCMCLKTYSLLIRCIFASTETPATCPPMRCSSHGQLQPNGTCLCEKGWSGQLCEEGKAISRQSV